MKLNISDLNATFYTLQTLFYFEVSENTRLINLNIVSSKNVSFLKFFLAPSV